MATSSLNSHTVTAAVFRKWALHSRMGTASHCRRYFRRADRMNSQAWLLGWPARSPHPVIAALRFSHDWHETAKKFLAELP